MAATNAKMPAAFTFLNSTVWTLDICAHHKNNPLLVSMLILCKNFPHSDVKPEIN